MMCSDDRFSPESTVFNRPTAEEYAKADPATWDGITPEEYFRRAFKFGKESHRLVQILRGFFPQLYERAFNEHHEARIQNRQKVDHA